MEQNENYSETLKVKIPSKENDVNAFAEKYAKHAQKSFERIAEGLQSFGKVIQNFSEDEKLGF